MPEIRSPKDGFQQDPGQRNNELGLLLIGGWRNFNILRIRREPVPSNPPNPAGPKDGVWIIEIP